MSVEFCGMISTQYVSEIHDRRGPVVDPDYVRRFARAHEDAGFDSVLVALGSASPDPNQVAGFAAAHTERLRMLIAHRPGFVAPTVAARIFATLDQLSGGRVTLHTITGGNDHEQRRDGDHLGKEERYARTDEYLDILKLAWTSTEPFDYHGSYYDLAGFVSEVRPVQQPTIPVSFGGSSAAAYGVGGKHADLYALWGEPLAETAEQIAAVHTAARAAGRTTMPRISVSFRPIVAATDDLAWERAATIPPRIEARRAAGPVSTTMSRARPVATAGDGRPVPENIGSQRLLAVADRAERHDRALWTGTVKAIGPGAGNAVALVGSPETVAAALLDYVDLGVTTLLIRGFDPFEDAVDYGRHVIPLVRQELARRATPEHVAV